MDPKFAQCKYTKAGTLALDRYAFPYLSVTSEILDGTARAAGYVGQKSYASLTVVHRHASVRAVTPVVVEAIAPIRSSSAVGS